MFESQLSIPSQFVQMFPYVLAVVVLAGFVGKSRAPAADGKPYIKGED
jgi:simple sugar transport system permease protein